MSNLVDHAPYFRRILAFNGLVEFFQSEADYDITMFFRRSNYAFNERYLQIAAHDIPRFRVLFGDAATGSNFFRGFQSLKTCKSGLDNIVWVI